MSKKTLFIVDIDGTLTIPTISTPKPVTDADWQEMYKTAEANQLVFDKLKSTVREGDLTMLCTGRRDSNRAITVEWLRDKLIYAAMLMRDDYDMRSNVDVKRSWYKHLQSIYGSEYKFLAIDDDAKVREMAMVELGITALHPAMFLNLIPPLEEYTDEFIRSAGVVIHLRADDTLTGGDYIIAQYSHLGQRLPHYLVTYDVTMTDTEKEEMHDKIKKIVLGKGGVRLQ
jgi:hypothetical protein